MSLVTHRIRRLQGAVFAAAWGVFAIPGAVAAAPVTLNYDIGIHTRFDHVTSEEEPYSLSFPLTLTFDDQVTRTSSTFVIFGEPLFSAIPLPTVGPGLAGASGVVVRDHFFQEMPGITVDVAGLSNRADFPAAETSLRLEHEIFPPLTIEDVSTILVAGGPTSRFLFVDYAFTLAGPVPGSSTYLGTATLRTAAPVPEPASGLLFATALAGLGARRWHARRSIRGASAATRRSLPNREDLRARDTPTSRERTRVD